MTLYAAILARAVTEARKRAEEFADYHTWDYAAGAWDTAQAILEAAGAAAVPCKSRDCDGRTEDGEIPLCPARRRMGEWNRHE